MMAVLLWQVPRLSGGTRPAVHLQLYETSHCAPQHMSIWGPCWYISGSICCCSCRFRDFQVVANPPYIHNYVGTLKCSGPMEVDSGSFLVPLRLSAAALAGSETFRWLPTHPTSATMSERPSFWPMDIEWGCCVRWTQSHTTVLLLAQG